MNKALLIGVFFAGAVAFVSCKKDRVCQCTVKTTGLVNTTVTNDTTIANSSKKDAKTKCEGYNNEVSILGNTIKTTCELK